MKASEVKPGMKFGCLRIVRVFVRKTYTKSGTTRYQSRIECECSCGATIDVALSRTSNSRTPPKNCRHCRVMPTSPRANVREHSEYTVSQFKRGKFIKLPLWHAKRLGIGVGTARGSCVWISLASYENAGDWLRYAPEILKCDLCGKEFVRSNKHKRTRRAEGAKHQYCSTSCSTKGSRRYNYDLVEAMRLRGATHAEIASELKCTAERARRIAKKCEKLRQKHHAM